MIRLLALLLLPIRRALRPPAPGRFNELTRLFRIAFPDADAERWEVHADDLAAAAYWEGERRGYDRARGLDEGALRARHDWSAARDRPALANALAGLRSPDDPLAWATPEQVEMVREYLREGGSFELVVTPDADGEDPAHEGIPGPPETHPRSR